MSSNLRLDWCSFEAAKYACEHWHYSRAMPNTRTVKLGVWEGGSFTGAVVFGDGANPGAFQPYGLGNFEGAELVRVALRAHETPVSRIVSVAVRILKRRCPALRVVVSYADPEQGHLGTIYQAAGWLYVGRSIAADEYIVRGVRMHGRALRATRSTHRVRNLRTSNVEEWARQVLDPNVRRVPGSSKYRYVLPLDAEIRSRVWALAKPYPRRRSVGTDAPADQAGEGGETPTRRLQPA